MIDHPIVDGGLRLIDKHGRCPAVMLMPVLLAMHAKLVVLGLVELWPRQA